MITTAVQNLNDAHRATFAIAQRASVALKGYEGTGAVLTRAEIAACIGLNLHEANETDRLLIFLAVDAAIAFRGWSVIESDDSTVKRFTKRPTTRHYRRPSISPVARARARA